MRYRMPDGSVACVDRFDSTSDIPRRRRTYGVIKQRVVDAGRFSIFEATADDLNARLFTQLHDDTELVLDNTRGYPWIYVRRV